MSWNMTLAGKWWRRRDSIRFLPKAWLEWLPPLASTGDPQWWIYSVLDSRDGGPQLLYGHDADGRPGEARRDRQRSCSTNVLAWASNALVQAPSDEQLLSIGCATILQWSEGGEPKTDAIRPAVKKTLDDLYPKLEKMALVLKPLIQLPASVAAVPTRPSLFGEAGDAETLQLTDNLLKLVNEVEPKAVLDRCQECHRHPEGRPAPVLPLVHTPEEVRSPGDQASSERGGGQAAEGSRAGSAEPRPELQAEDRRCSQRQAAGGPAPA